MILLERAIAIAVQAHAGQRDKAGRPYILHPLRVMSALSTDDERIVGVLHDVVEDSQDRPDGWTFARLRAEGFSAAIIEALDSVTRRTIDGAMEDYFDFVRRAGANPIGRHVKIADLRDNSDLSRIAAPTAADHARLEKYRRALELLGA
jgi:hypothetical protein